MQDEFPKCPICGSTDGYELSGILGRYAKCYVCNAKWQLFVKNKQISELMLHELPKNGSGVYTITSTKEPLFTVFGTRLPIEFWRDLKLDKKINWEFMSEIASFDASKAVIKRKGEKLLQGWEGTRKMTEKQVMNGNTVETTKSESGVLLLSTQKLRWLVRRERGFWKRVVSFLVVYEIPLEDIRGISGSTKDSRNWESSFNEISIVDSKNENTFNLKYAILELFKPIVESAIEIRRKEIDTEKRKERLHIMLDFSFLKTYMEKGGLVMKVLKCPECNGTVEFPKNGTKTKCSHCGKEIYAQDIFEKVKSLLE